MPEKSPRRAIAQRPDRGHQRGVGCNQGILQCSVERDPVPEDSGQHVRRERAGTAGGVHGVPNRLPAGA